MSFIINHLTQSYPFRAPPLTYFSVSHISAHFRADAPSFWQAVVSFGLFNMGAVQINVVVHQDAEVFRKDFSLRKPQTYFTDRASAWSLSYLLDSTNMEDYTKKPFLIWIISEK